MSDDTWVYRSFGCRNINEFLGLQNIVITCFLCIIVISVTEGLKF
jgi:hypothetical protein